MKKYISNIIIYVLFGIMTMTFYSCQDLTGKVSVDFQKKQNVNSMVGFLHFRDINTLVPDIKGLQPKYWRFRLTETSRRDVDFLIEKNIIPIIVVSDKYGYPNDTPELWKSPLKSNDYKNIVKNTYLELGNKVIYDLWNEPYHKAFGDFKKEDFYKLFKESHDVIRSLPGGDKAIISGPSFDHYNEADIEGFLKFCTQNNVRVDILSWHDWRYGDELLALQNDIIKVKKEILPKYPLVGVKKIHLSEIIHKSIQFSPTQIFKLFDGLEKSNLDGACRSCWEESDGVLNCEKNTMGGLLDLAGRPRSVWWATKLYSQSTNNRVKSKTNLKELIPFASYDKDEIFILLANNYNKSIKKTTLNLSNLSKLTFFNEKTNTIKLNVYKIPTTGEKTLEKPLFLYSKTLKFTDKMNVNIDEILPKETFYITLSMN